MLAALAGDVKPLFKTFVELATEGCRLYMMDEPFPSPAQSAADAFARATAQRSENAGEKGADENAPLSGTELGALLADDTVDTSLGLGPSPKAPHWKYGGKSHCLPTESLVKGVKGPKIDVATTCITHLSQAPIRRSRPVSPDKQDVPADAKKATLKRKAGDDGEAVEPKTMTKRARVSNLSASPIPAPPIATAAALTTSNVTTPAADATAPAPNAMVFRLNATAPVFNTIVPTSTSTVPISTSMLPTPAPAPAPASPTKATPTTQRIPSNLILRVTVPEDKPPKKTDPSPHKCSHAECKYHTLGFKRREHKTRHETTVHQKVVAAVWPGCAKEFSRMDNLKPHLGKCDKASKMFPSPPPSTTAAQPATAPAASSSQNALLDVA
jgi:hypothetical protein